MYTRENKNSKTGNQNKKCAEIKSVTAYHSMGVKVFFWRQIFSFTHIGSESKKKIPVDSEVSSNGTSGEWVLSPSTCGYRA